MPILNVNHQDLFFIWDSLNDRRINCIDLINSEAGLDADTVEHLDETAMQADRIQDLITIAMQED